MVSRASSIRDAQLGLTYPFSQCVMDLLPNSWAALKAKVMVHRRIDSWYEGRLVLPFRLPYIRLIAVSRLPAA